MFDMFVVYDRIANGVKVMFNQKEYACKWRSNKTVCKSENKQT